MDTFRLSASFPVAASSTSTSAAEGLGIRWLLAPLLHLQPEPLGRKLNLGPPRTGARATRQGNKRLRTT